MCDMNPSSSPTKIIAGRVPWFRTQSQTIVFILLLSALGGFLIIVPSFCTVDEKIPHNSCPVVLWKWEEMHCMQYHGGTQSLQRIFHHKTHLENNRKKTLVQANQCCSTWKALKESMTPLRVYCISLWLYVCVLNVNMDSTNIFYIRHIL